MIIHRLPNGYRYGLMGEHPGHPAPTLFVLAASLETMRDDGHFNALGRTLARYGFMSIMLDPPAHGEDWRKGEGNGMEGALVAWRQRLDRGEDLVGPFNRRAEEVLNYLIQQRLADPARVGAFGISRGGFLAFHLAAADARIQYAAALSPLIDPMALSEFVGDSQLERAEAVSAIRLAPKLAGRPIWIGISNDDMRVDVGQIIAFTRAVVRASAQGQKPYPVIPVELVMGPASAAGGKGHYALDEGNALLANWILKFYGRPESVPLEESARE
jgi:dienelactone hydrolase